MSEKEKPEAEKCVNEPPFCYLCTMIENDITREFIRTHADADVRALALRKPPAGVNLQWALQQIEGRQMATRKLPLWTAVDGLWWPPRLALEQCSSQATAQYKNKLTGASKGTLYDLTGGIGVDFTCLAQQFEEAVYVERNATLCEIVKHNLPLLGVGNATVRCAEAEEMAEQLEQADVVMLDPARRDSAGRKTVQIEDCTPDICKLLPTLLPKVGRLLIKRSPMLDITAAVRAIPQITEVHVVSVGGECKELLLVVPGERASEAERAEELRIHAVMIRTAFSDADDALSLSFTPVEERQTSLQYADMVGEWLYEPDAAILKAGGLRVIAARYGVKKIAPMSHLYTSDNYISGWPGKCFRVEGVYGFSKADLRKLQAETPRADITVRGFPQTVAQLRAQLKIKEGGEAHLFATTLNDGRKVLIKGGYAAVGRGGYAAV